MSLIPGFALALLAAVLGLAAPAALGELPWFGLPFATTRVRALSNALPCIVLATSISHDDARPILNFQRMHGPMSEFFDNRKDVRPRSRVKG